MMKYSKIFLLIILCTFGCANLKNSLNTEDFLRFKMHKANVVGLQAAVVKDGKLNARYSLGKLNAQESKSINDSTLFMIASCSKPITALTILKVLEDKKISLDEPINAYLKKPIIHPYHSDEEITFRALLTHTSGIKDNWEVLDSLYTLPKGGDSNIELKSYVYDVLSSGGKYFAKDRSFHNTKPAEFYDYANTGYALLGVLVEEITKKPFHIYSRENILKPLGMNDSFWTLREISHANISNPHEIKEEYHEVLNHYGYPTYPDGQLRTTVTDYAKFLIMLINNGRIGDIQFLSQSMVDEFLKVQYPEAHKWQSLAWNYNEFENFLFYMHIPRYAAHTGGDPGIATAVFFNREKKGAVLLFLNTRLNNFKGVKNMYLDVLKRLSKESGL